MPEVDLWKQLILQAPTVAAILFLVVRGLQMFREWQDKLMATAASQADRIAACMDRNTEMLGRVAELLRRSGEKQ